MKYFTSPIRHYARLAICSTSLLFCAQQVWASDAAAPHKAKAAEEASISVTSTTQPSIAPELQTEKPGKYDINRIGQRDVGHGVNIYSMQKERALGESMASTIDRGTKFVADFEINDYISRLGQKIARNQTRGGAYTKVIDSPDLKFFCPTASSMSTRDDHGGRQRRTRCPDGSRGARQLRHTTRLVSQYA
jgi:hypothetical protein